MIHYDVIVIGTGEAGTTVAQKCAAAAKKVAIIDYRPYGGTCSLRGCDPKKVLVGAAEVVAHSNQLKTRGIKTQAVIDWPELMRFKKSFVDAVPAKREESLKEAGVVTYHGVARFTSSTTIKVNEEELKATQFVIATGAVPRQLGISGEDLLIDSTDFLDLADLPRDITFIGGGYIAFEFAHIAVRSGAKVRIVHRGDLPLESFDPDLVGHLLKASRDAGIEIILNTEVKAIEKQDDAFLIRAESEGKEISFHSSLAVHAAGRVPELDKLALESADIAYNQEGITVNTYLQSTSQPHVYACGDASASGLRLTPVGVKEAFVAASNLLKGNHTEIEYVGIPTNVFSLPPLATVGLTEQEAHKQGINVKVNYEETTDWFTSKRLNEPVSAFKILIDKSTDQIIGAHVLGPHAEEVINLFAVAIHAGMSASRLRKMVFSYPTSASDIVYMV